MVKVKLLILMIILLFSCQVSKQYSVKSGEWVLETENNFSVIKDTVRNKKYYYNANMLGKRIYGEIPIELFSLPLFNIQVQDRENKDFEKKYLDDLTKSVLKSVEFNIETDTLYFIIRGHILVYSSPDFERKKITDAISLNGDYDWSIMDPPIRAVYEDHMSEWNDNEIFRVLYCYPRRKLYLIKDCFRIEDRYLNFVYIFQSLTKKNKNTTPREWRTMWDVTSPQKIFHTVDFFKTANALSIKNKFAD